MFKVSFIVCTTEKNKIIEICKWRKKSINSVEIILKR